MAIAIIDPQDEALITVPWTDAIGSLGLGPVTHTVPTPLTKMSESTDAESKTSQVKVSGAKHGGLYMIEVESTLSNGERINRQFPVRCFNS